MDYQWSVAKFSVAEMSGYVTKEKTVLTMKEIWKSDYSAPWYKQSLILLLSLMQSGSQSGQKTAHLAVINARYCIS